MKRIGSGMYSETVNGREVEIFRMDTVSGLSRDRGAWVLAIDGSADDVYPSKAEALLAAELLTA